MQRISDLRQIEKLEPGCVLTIGNFDGVHIGHQQILRVARRAADERAVAVVAMTFEPHPLAVVRPGSAPPVLTPLELKAALLSDCGVDLLFVAESTPELLALSPEQFVQRFMVEHIRPSLVVEGRGFGFARGRSGTIETLAELGRVHGFEVEVLEPMRIELAGGTQKVSSTLVRELLAAGRVREAAAALGRAYRLIGPVVPGRGRGRRLGFPTANMGRPAQVLPAEGVYAGRAEFADSAEVLFTAGPGRPAAVSIGTTATYGQTDQLLIEAHVLGSRLGELYGKYVAMDFVERLREQRKFATESELAGQIADDCEKARRILDRAFGGSGEDADGTG